MSHTDLMPADKASFLPMGDLTMEPSVPDGIANLILFHSPELRVTLFRFEPGQELTPHKSHRRAIVEVLEGRGEFLFDGDWQTLEAGALLHVPAGEEHAVRATDGPLRMLLTLAG